MGIGGNACASRIRKGNGWWLFFCAEKQLFCLDNKQAFFKEEG